ncbi:MAG TPA: DUF2855 family protein, partial [Polyangiales bacterium]|nr:DUF2855 family protein [Polyangiales bacterium]
PLDDGAVLLRVDRFSLTANNITYAMMGDAMQYWGFFPAPAGWGRIPVWGYANVVASRCPDLREGERVFGYLPISTYAVMQPAAITALAFTDASPHRRALPATYQRYARVKPSDATEEDLHALMRPLFGTGFLIDAWLAERERFGAKQILLGSASSKTALATAFMLSRRQGRDFEVVALTSARNRAFCEKVGYYDRVIDYSQIQSLAANVPSMLVDMSGNREVLTTVHRHFAGNLRQSTLVGLTHRDPAVAQPAPDLPGPTPEFFFAPTHLEAGVKAHGPDGFAKLVGQALQAFLTSARAWIQIEHGSGPEAIESAYRRVLDGKLDPDRGIILSP